MSFPIDDHAPIPADLEDEEANLPHPIYITGGWQEIRVHPSSECAELRPYETLTNHIIRERRVWICARPLN